VCDSITKEQLIALHLCERIKFTDSLPLFELNYRIDRIVQLRTL